MSGRLLMLGPPGLEQAGMHHELRRDRPTSLLLYLATRNGWVTRSEIALLYHPDQDETASRNNVRKLLHRLQRLDYLPEGSLILDGERVRCTLDSDRNAFLEALDREAWGEAVDLARGLFLAGFDLRNAPAFSAWVDLERQDLARRWHRATSQRAEELEADGAFEAAHALYQTLLAADGLDEEALQGALRALHALGRRREALDVFTAFRQQLRLELDVEPLDTTAALADAIRRDEVGRRRPPPGLPLPEARHNLPLSVTPLVGREVELDEASRLLDLPEVRLLTVTGLGGIGKTRFTLELARRRLERYPDGVWLVQLSGVEKPGRLPIVIASTLGLTLTAPTPPVQQLAEQLGQRRALLLLDNAEQFVAESAFLCDLLASATNLQLLITSRTPLELSCETVAPLPGLRYPRDGDDEGRPEEYPGVQLFLERARRVDASFRPNADELREIAAIVAQVAGMPLAIELAASWVRSLDLQRLRRDLARDLSLLQSELRDLPERQRSVAGILDYTLERLPTGERQALAGLAVFGASFTLEAAEAVTGIHLGQLFTLINRALVQRSPDSRYELHALVRQHARAHSRSSMPETAHAAYYAAFAERWCDPLQSERQLEALAEVRSEWDNLLKAWQWAAARADAGLLERSRRTLLYACYLGSLFTEEHQLIRTALDGLERPGGQTAHPRLRATLYGELADVLRRLGDLPAARAALAEAQQLSNALDDPGLQAKLSLHDGRIAESGADYDAALASLQQIDEGKLEPIDRVTLQRSLGNLAYYRFGNLEAAEVRYRRSLELSEQLGDLSLLAAALINLGGAAFDRGAYPEAEHQWRRAAELAGRLRQRQRQAVVLNNLGHLASVRGAADEASELYRRSLAMRHEIGDDRGAAHTLASLARLEHARGDHRSAAKRFEAALARYRRLQDDSGIAYTLSGYARTLLELEQPQRAASLALDALTLASSTGDRTDILSSLTTVAMVRRHQGRTEEALRLAALVTREASGSHEGVRHHAARLLADCTALLTKERTRTLMRDSATLELSGITAQLLSGD